MSLVSTYKTKNSSHYNADGVCGHVTRVPDDCIPKHLFYGQLPGRARSQGSQLERYYKDAFRIKLKTCDIPASSWESLAENRPKWQELCYQQIALFHDNRLHELKHRWQQRKDGVSSTSGSDNACHICEVKSADATAVPVSDYSLTSQNVIDEIRHSDCSVHESMLNV